MKTLLIIACFLFTLQCSFAQKTDYLKVKGIEYKEFMLANQYKYPEYKRAKIYFKNGDMASARMNYDYINQLMKYIGEKNDTLVIANEKDLDYIAIGTDSFFYDNGYYEWVASSGKARLACRKTLKEGPRALIGAFGTSSPAKNIESKSKILQESSYELSPNEEVTFTRETTYYISQVGGSKARFELANKNNFDKLFPKKKVSDFIKENNLNLYKEQDLIDVMVYIAKEKQ
jgi:hypothetical protein